MQLPVAIGLAVVAFLILLRRYAARRVARRDGRFIWLMFIPTLVAGFAILGVGVQMLVTQPLAGVLMAITGSVYIAALIGFLTRSSRAIAASRSQDDILTAMTEPLADYVGTLIGFVLIGGLAALVGLVVWAVSQAAH